MTMLAERGRKGCQFIPLSVNPVHLLTYYQLHTFHVGVTDMKEGHHLLDTHLTSSPVSLLVLL